MLRSSGSRAGRVLEQIVVINAAGRIILQAISAPSGGGRSRRLVETETVPNDEARLMRRLTELVPALCKRDAIGEATD